MKAGETRQIERQLQAVRRRIRRVQLWRGGLWVAAFFLGGLFFSMALDWLFAPLPSLARWAVFLLWMAAVVWSLFRGLGPFFQKLSLVRIARWLESRHPEMEERLSTALELSGQDSASPALVASLVQAAEEDVLLVDAQVEVQPGQRTRQWRWVVGAALLALVMALVIWPQTAGRLLVRSVAPFSEVGNVGARSFDLQPGDLEVMAGGAVEIRLAYSGPGEPEILLEFKGGEQVVQPFTKSEGSWLYRLEPVQETFRYRARSGRAVSDQFLANVLPKPELLEVMVEKKYPDYTGLPTERDLLGESVQAVVGTQVGLAGLLNTAVEKATLALPDGQRVAMELEASAKEARFVGGFELLSEMEGEVAVEASHRLGGSAELTRFQVRATPDLAPVVTRLNPTEDEIKVRPEEELQLDYEVREDFGLGEVVLEVEAGKSGSLSIPQDLPDEVGRAQPRRFSGVTRFVVADLMEQLDGARELHVRIRAEDKVPAELGGPGKGYSGWLIIRAQKGAQSLAQQELRAQHDDARSSIEKAIREVREADKKMRQSWGALVDNHQNEQSQKAIQQAQEKLAEAQKKLSELNERMEQGIHAAKAPQVDEAKQDLAEALEKFEKVPLLDTKEERVKELENALSHSQEAIQTLEKLRNEIHQDRSKIEDLARLEDLAQKQSDLARQAEKKAMESESGESPSEQWQREQKAMAQEVKKQMYQRPEAMAEVFQQQAEQARDLAKESQEAAESQAKLAEMAQELAESGLVSAKDGEEELRAALRQAQTELANEISQKGKDPEQSSEAKRQSKEGQKKAYQAAKEVTQKQDEQAAKSSQEAAEKLKEAVESSSEAGKEQAESFAERQEQLAKAMAALEKGDTEESSQHLAQAEAIAKGEESSPQQAEASSQEESSSENESLQAEVAAMLESEQAAIAQEAREQLAKARSEGSPLANALPEAAAQAQEAKEAFSQSEPGEISKESQEAAEALQTASEQAEEVAQGGDPESKMAAEDLSDLAERQEQVSQAAEALAKGDLGEALAELQAMAQGDAEDLASEIRDIPQLQGSSLNQAGQEAQRGQQQAQRASEESTKGRLEQSSQQHGQADDSFQKAAQSLGKAAEQLQQKAAEASQRQTPQHQAPTSAAQMAEGFQSSESAARTESAAEAAQQARQAADALAQAAQASRQQMQGQQGQPKPSPPGESQQPQPGPPGEEAPESAEMQIAEADQGVPPELAKLGISVDDWAKIKASLQKDVGGQGGIDVPDDYQGLVKDYFQTMSEQ
ncbi:MAG: hypothetical protein ACSHYB_13775 [Roseibacillus sp.]